MTVIQSSIVLYVAGCVLAFHYKYILKHKQVQVSFTGFEVVFEVGHQVVLFEQELPVQVRYGEVCHCTQALNNKLFITLLLDLSCQIPHIVLKGK